MSHLNILWNDGNRHGCGASGAKACCAKTKGCLNWCVTNLYKRSPGSRQIFQQHRLSFFTPQLLAQLHSTSHLFAMASSLTQPELLPQAHTLSCFMNLLSRCSDCMPATTVSHDNIEEWGTEFVGADGVLFVCSSYLAYSLTSAF